MKSNIKQDIDNIFEVAKQAENIVDVMREYYPRHTLTQQAKGEYRTTSVYEPDDNFTCTVIFTDTNTFHDYKADKSGDIIDLIANVTNRSLIDIARTLAGDSGYTSEYRNAKKKYEQAIEKKYLKGHENLKNYPDILQYLHSRRISDETIERFKIGALVNSKTGEVRVSIPYFNESGTNIIYGATRRFSNPDSAKYLKEFIPQELKDSGYTEPLMYLNTVNVKDKNLLIIGEGVFDVLSAVQEGYSGLCYVGGSTNAKNLPVIQRFASQFKKVVLTFDNDFQKLINSGQNFTVKTAQTLLQYGITNFYAVREYGEKHKDVSDFYSAGGELSDLIEKAVNGVAFTTKIFMEKKSLKGDISTVEKGKNKKELKNFYLQLQSALSDDDETMKKCKDIFESKYSKNTIKEFSKEKSKKAEKEEKQPKRNLNAVNIERKINELGIDVKFNAITHEVSVKNIPLDSEYVFDGFRKLSKAEQERLGSEMLPVVLKPMLKDESFKFSESFFDNALSVITSTHEFNPVVDALQAIKWDGVDRLEQLYELTGIQYNSLYRTFVKKWLWQAVAMAHNDKEGRFNNDFILVLRGRQGVGKSTFFQVLVEGLLSNSDLFKGGVVVDTENKDTLIATTTKWVCELAELDSTLAKRQSDFKDFITRRFDEYRIPYGKEQKKYPRYTVFGATVNPSQFLTDTDEGTRRYATVEVEDINFEKLRDLLKTDFYRQLWRQVYETCFMVNPKGFLLTSDERVQQEQNNERFSTNKPFEDEILDSLDWNAPIEAWQFYTSTQVKLMLQEQNILPSNASSEKIGRALTAVVNKKKNAEKKRTGNQRLYKLPPVKHDVLHNFEVVEDVEVEVVQPVEVAPPGIDVKEREKLYEIESKIRRQGRYFTGGYDKKVFEAIKGCYTVFEVQKAVERLRDEADTQIGKNFFDGIVRYINEMNTKTA